MVMVDKEVAKVADQVTREVQSAMTQTVVGRWELIGSPRTFLTTVMVMMVDKVADQVTKDGWVELRNNFCDRLFNILVLSAIHMLALLPCSDE